MGREYISANVFLRRMFGEKVYKLSLSAAETCPNRDGTKGFGGCTFCSAVGSGDFAAPSDIPLGQQIEFAKGMLHKKAKNALYMAYFQSFTGTYGDIDKLFGIYEAAAGRDDIAAVSIATRPDCLQSEVLERLRRLSEIKPLIIELGLQTSNEETAKRINRGYPRECYEEAMRSLEGIAAHRITHIIFGLPGETPDDMLETVKYAGEYTDGVKLQLLHILRGTALEESYRRHEFSAIGEREYCETVAKAILALPEKTVIHRLTGDGAKKNLIAPLWSADKKSVISYMNKTLSEFGISAAKE